MTTTEILTGIKTWVLNKLSLKQDVINDLAAIRSGSQAGSTAVQPSDLSSYFNNASYDTNTHRINFYHGQNVVAYVDASPFIVDGMVNDVRIENGYLVIDFNTDSGKQDISIPLTDIFDPNNYYNKTQTDGLLAQKQDVIQDLANIRSGASAGATAVQPSTLNNVVKNTVAESGVYDVSANNDNTKFESLSALLSSANLNTLIPTDIRKGGMSMKFVQSSDNKYVQARCMAQNFTTDVTQWQGVDEELTPNSINLIESGVVEKVTSPLSNNSTPISLYKWIDNYYIGTDGSQHSQANFHYSQPIFITIGTTVEITTISTTWVSVISEVAEDGSFIRNLVTGKNGSEGYTYTFTADKSMYVCLCVTNKGGSIHHKNISDYVAENYANVDVLKNNNSINLADLTYIGGYVGIDGAVHSQSGIYHTNSSIKVYKGDVVTITTNTNSSISLISIVTNDGYTNVLSGNGSATYTWVSDRDCEIVISLISKVGSIIHKSVYSQIDDINEELDDLTTDKVTGGSAIEKIAGAFKTNGTTGYSTQFKRSTPILVENGEIITFTGIATTDSICLIAKVDSSGNFISSLLNGKTGTINYQYIVNESCYISISLANNNWTDNQVKLTIKSTLTKINDEIEDLKEHAVTFWTGKRIMAIGDSLTASTGPTNWQYVMGTNLGCNIRTHAKGGIGLIAMVDGDGEERPEADPDDFGVAHIYPLEAEDVEDVDLILLFGAFNEYRRARDTYGTMTDMYPTQDTYLGRLRYVASRLIEVIGEGNPDCKIAFISPYCFGGGAYCDATGYDAGEKLLEGMVSVAKENCFAVIDLLHNGQIARYNWDVFCAGGGTTNTKYLPYDDTVPYGTPSIFPTVADLPSTALDGIIALVAANNSFGYTYSQYTEGSGWTNGISPWGSAEYPPYIYNWKDFIHLKATGQGRIGNIITHYVNSVV